MRRDEEGAVRSALGYSTLPGTVLPVNVTLGDILAVTRVEFEWQGPARTLYLCFGLKQGEDFNNGAGLEGGASKFGYAAVSVPASTGKFTKYAFDIDARLNIDSSIRMGVIFDTWKWIAKTPTTDESQTYVIDVDAGTVVTSTYEGVQNLDCNYVKV